MCLVLQFLFGPVSCYFRFSFSVFTVGIEQVETTRNVKWWKCLNLKEGLLNHGMTCIGAATRKKVLCIFVPDKTLKLLLFVFSKLVISK